MIDKTRVSSSMQLERVALLLSIGEAVTQLSEKIEPKPWGGPSADNDPYELRSRVVTLTTDFRSRYPEDPALKPLWRIFQTGPAAPAEEVLWVVATVAYTLAATLQQRDASDALAIRTGCMFSSNRIKGVILARQIIGKLLQKRILVLKDHWVGVCPSLRYWLAGNNAFAVAGADEQDTRLAMDRASRLAGAARGQHRSLRARIRELPLLKPSEYYDEIGKRGYIGQHEARKAVSLAAYRHVDRLRRVHLDRVDPDTLPPKQNAILIGPTGSGKSFMVQALFEHILKLPTAITDATSITEAGYVGEDVSIILSQLLLAAEGNTEWAQCGISAIDEFDKLAACGEHQAVFGGAGTKHDVSRGGAQRGLLKIMEEHASINIPARPGQPINRASIPFHTRHVTFFCCGAFTGLDTVTATRPRIGYGDHAPAGAFDDHAAALIKFGISRELIGRAGTVVRLAPLSIADLSAILDRNVIQRYTRELSLGGIDLQIDDAVKQAVAGRALERGTGARGLNTEMQALLNDACYDAYSAPGEVKRIRVNSEGGVIHWDIEHHAGKSARHQREEVMQACA